jgi:glutamate-1-semialdehyde 2,1-aminomutase
MRLHGLALSWVGSGRIIFSLNFRDEDFAQVALKFVDAARQMREDGWWLPTAAQSNRDIRRSILKEMLQHRM